MLRKTFTFTAIAAFSLALGACALYLDDDDDDFVSDPGARPGSDCIADANCAEGCFCNADGFCEEAGFCNERGECDQEGFECDADRNSCVPRDDSGCKSDDDCTGEGEVCDLETGACGLPQGEATCLPDAETLGEEPECGTGQSAEIIGGQWTGNCIPNAECTDAPQCKALVAEGACAAREDCGKVFRGIDCENPADPTQDCSNDPTDCQCASFEYDSCEAIEVTEPPAG